MNSVRHEKSKIFGIVLCAVLVLSVYVGFVGFVSELFGNDFIEMVTLSSKTSSPGSCQFAMGDTILVSASVKRGNVYRVNVYDGSDRLVFTTAGDVKGSTVNVSVPVQPPAFNASRAYSLSLEARIIAYPLLGVDAYDSSAKPFTVVDSMTRLNVTADYDESTHGLRSVVFLTTSDGASVGNAAVSFYMQPNVDFVKPDRGWTYLGTAKTGADGCASYSCGLLMMGGLHGLEARFAGDQGYGSSTATSQFNVSYGTTLVRIAKASCTASSMSLVLQLTNPSGYPLGGKVVSLEAPALSAQASFAVTDDNGYAVLNLAGPVRGYVDSDITVLGDDYISRYQACVRFVQNGSEMSFVSKLSENGAGNLTIGDGHTSLAPSTALHASRARALDSSDEFFVSAGPNASACVDLPEYIDCGAPNCSQSYGTLNFTFTVANATNNIVATMSNITDSGKSFLEKGVNYTAYLATAVWEPEAWGNYTVNVDVVDENRTEVWQGSIPVSVSPAYCSVVVYYPGAFSGNSLNLTVAFSRARTENQTDGSGLFQTTEFARLFGWGNDTYAVDEPTGSPSINVYVNSTSVTNVTSADGEVCSFQYPFNGSSLPFHLNVTAAFEQNSRFQRTVTSQVFNLARVTVLDDPNATNNASSFTANYTMSVLNGTDTTYVNSNNMIATQVAILNRTAYNVTTSFTAGYLGSRKAPDSAGNVSVPTDRNYTLLRVVLACSSDTGTPDPWTDLNRDGYVDMWDIALVTSHFLASLDHPGSGYNWTFDVNADGCLDMLDIGLIAANFCQDVYYYGDSFDYRGVKVYAPNGSSVGLDSRGFASVPSGAKWLNVTCRCDVEFFYSVTNASARTDNGGHSWVTWNPSDSPEVCVVEDKVSTPFNVTVAVDNAPAQLNASTCTANYYYLYKHQIDISLSWDSQLQTAFLKDCNDTYVQVGDNSTHGGDSNLCVWSSPVDRAYVRFNLINAVPSGAYVVSAMLNVISASGAGDGNLTIYRVTSDWNENTLNGTQLPNMSSTASCTQNVSAWANVSFAFDVTADVRFWSNASNPNYGFAILAYPNTGQVRNLYSRDWDNASCAPSLQISYLNGSQDILVSAYDEALKGPASNLAVTFNVNGAFNANGTTNQTGLWDRGSWWPSTGGAYSLSAFSTENSNCSGGSSSSLFNLGLPTSVTSLDGNPTNLSPGTIVSNFTVSSSGLFNVSGVTVNFLVSGTYTNGTLYSRNGSSITLADGSVSFNWSTTMNGTYSIHASFMGDNFYAPCDGYQLASVTTLPLSVLFSVTPSEFVPGTQVTLNATVIDPLTGSVTSHNVGVNFQDFVSNGSRLAIGSSNSSNGVALYNLTYPSDGNAHAYAAVIANCTDFPKIISNVVSSPVQLTVGWNTTLSLNVQNTSSPIQYRLAGCLMNGTQPIGNRTITLTINDTQLTATTVANGAFCLAHDFPPVNNGNATTYTVTACFSGENSTTASANATFPDGTRYTTCTTTQFSLKPAQNNTLITVTPQSALATTVTKTPDEMKQEAKQSGMLQRWDEWSWCPPFYRLHFAYVYEGLRQFDEGISLVPFVGDSLKVADQFLNILSTVWWRIIWPITAAVVGSEFAALVACNAGPEVFIPVLAISLGVKWGALWSNWDNVDALVSALIGGVVASVIGLVRSGLGFAMDFFKLLLGLKDIATVGFGNLYRMFSFPVNILYIGTIMTRLHALGTIA